MVASQATVWPSACPDFCSGVLTNKIGMKRCVEVPHLFYDEETEVCLEVHVDDFYAVGPGEAAGNLLKRVAQYMTLTLEGPYDVIHLCPSEACPNSDR